MGQWSAAESENAIRCVSFLGVLCVLAVWELRAPRRLLTANKPRRWGSNLALVVLNTVCVRLILPATAVAVALAAELHEWGLLVRLQWPGWIEFVVSVVILDLAIYLQHVMFHAIPAFWKIHRVHHADLDFDVTTGLRFHTLEILLSAVIKLGMVSLLGPPVIAVVFFEVILNATSMFNHSNIRLSPRWDQLLRLVVVTPDMHRVHHSVDERESNMNFGFNLPWWDYLLGTYLAQPKAGHEGMVIGLAHCRQEREVDRLDGMLLMPFRRERAMPADNDARSTSS